MVLHRLMHSNIQSTQKHTNTAANTVSAVLHVLQPLVLQQLFG